MNSLSLAVVLASEGPAAAVLWLTVKLTIFLATTWLLHVVLRRRNPRWRVLVWRSSLAGFVVLAGLYALPPFWSWTLPAPPPAATGDRMFATATARGAELPIGDGPSEEQGAAGKSAAGRTAAPFPAPRAGHGESRLRPEQAATSSVAIASDRLARAGVGRRTSYLGVALAIWAGGLLIGILRTAIGLWRLARIRARAAEAPPWVIALGEDVARGLGLARACAIRRTRDLNSPCRSRIATGRSASCTRLRSRYPWALRRKGRGESFRTSCSTLPAEASVSTTR